MLEKDLAELSEWSTQQNLVFNNDKTTYMLFSSAQLSNNHNLHGDDQITVSCNNRQVKRTSTSKVLGIYFDQHISWKDHVNHLLKSSWIPWGL